MSSVPESSALADAASVVVTRLLDATFARDFDTSRTLLHDDAEFRLPGGREFCGVDEIIDGFKATLAPGLTAESTVLTQLSDGRIVMNERIERFTSARGSLDLRIPGVFEVVEGRVQRWTDYNDR